MTGEFVKALRIKLGMSQSQFSNAYHIPLDALKNWEQNRCTPDPSTKAYLHVIDAIPDKVESILSKISK